MTKLNAENKNRIVGEYLSFKCSEVKVKSFQKKKNTQSTNT